MEQYFKVEIRVGIKNNVFLIKKHIIEYVFLLHGYFTLFLKVLITVINSRSKVISNSISTELNFQELHFTQNTIKVIIDLKT